jgi:predicted esterase
MMRVATLPIHGLLVFVLGCHLRPCDAGASHRVTQQKTSIANSTAQAKAANLGPVRMEHLSGTEPATYVLRGGPKGEGRLVFLHGMCGHALGYAQSFQFSAAKKGSLVAPQGDRVCGRGPWALWSPDLDALDARIVGAFRALGEKEPINDITIMGYSQGATRAEALARKWPERYTRLVSIGAPSRASSKGLQHLRAAVMMAGERDRKDQMKAGARALRLAGVPSTFMVIPEATHGAMGPTPEQTMGEALDWLWQNAR